MASPKIECFVVYDESTGAPRTGIAGDMSFVAYKDDLGADLAQPAITEVGGGAYKFTPVFADAARGIVYVLNTGTGSAPGHISRYMRPEDWNDDELAVVRKVLTNKTQIHTTGPYINQLVVYDDDDTTVLLIFDLADEDGNPVAVNPYRKTPV
jgi:hypothetical protein